MVERHSGDFTQISYQEWDRQADSAYISYQITGWVPSAGDRPGWYHGSARVIDQARRNLLLNVAYHNVLE